MPAVPDAGRHSPTDYQRTPVPAPRNAVGIPSPAPPSLVAALAEAFRRRCSELEIAVRTETMVSKPSIPAPVITPSITAEGGAEACKRRRSELEIAAYVEPSVCEPTPIAALAEAFSHRVAEIKGDHER